MSRERPGRKKWEGKDSQRARALLAPLVAQGVPCYRCGKPILPGQSWQPDHIVDRVNGGTDDVSNLWPSHSRCNLVAGGKLGASITNGRRRGEDSFGNSNTAPACRPRAIFTGEIEEDVSWIDASPLILSPTPADTDIAAAREGARWLALPLLPQGENIARVVEARAADGTPLYDTVAVEAPRRSTKTTAVLATLLGRCLTRPGYLLASTAQDGLRARQKLVEVVNALRLMGFAEEGLGRLLQGAGTERIEFANGSLWRALPPDPGAFRSAAYDCVFVDEAGELAPEKADLLMAGILPTMDTRPESQVIVAGTPGLVRAGLLWETLASLEAGEPGVGGVVYAAAQHARAFELNEAGELVPNVALLASVHPGLTPSPLLDGRSLTTVAKVLKRLPRMGPEKWSAEYLCMWPSDAMTAALSEEAWETGLCSDPPTLPDRYGVAFDVDPDGSRAALVAAWRGPDRRPHFHVLACQDGTDWLPVAARPHNPRAQGGISYDAIGPNLDVADTMARAPYRLRLTPAKIKDMVAAADRTAKAINAGEVQHYGNPDLTDAVTGAAWRPLGRDGGRLFARQASAHSVAALVAASEALFRYDSAGGASAGQRRVRTAASIAARRA